MNELADVRLAPPGAGIPAVERLIGGRMLAWRRWRCSRERLVAQFGKERQAIARLYGGRNEGVLSTRVLIPRLPGLEDSSRYWSVLMTLDHLRIVNEQIGDVIEALTREVVPAGEASTAAVKPRSDAGPAVIVQYEAGCDRFGTSLASHDDLRSRARYAHPWFGPLDAAGWQALAVVHMGIHRKQIERILEMHAEGHREVTDQA